MLLLPTINNSLILHGIVLSLTLLHHLLNEKQLDHKNEIKQYPLFIISTHNLYLLPALEILPFVSRNNINSHTNFPSLLFFLSDYDSLNEEDMAGNNQLAFDLAEQEFGIQPVTRGREMAAEAEPDKLLMVLYLSKFYEAFWNSPENKNGQAPSHFCHRESKHADQLISLATVNP